MLGFGPSQASRRRRQGGIAPPPALTALSLAVPTIAENTAAGSVIGAILGRTGGSTLSLSVDDGGRFAILGGNLIAGPNATNFEAATNHAITIRETLAGATNSPRDTVLNVAVTNLFEAAVLGPLTLSETSYVTGVPLAGPVTGSTAGSAIVATGLPAGLTVNGPARTWAWDGTGNVGSSAITLTETLADSANSPRASSVGIIVAAASDTTAPTLSNPSDAANGATGASLSVATNEGNGTLYWFVSTSATPPGAANLKSGSGAVSFGSQAVSGPGAQAVAATGLIASTAYFAHFLHRDAAGNDSAIASGDGFTTTAGGSLAVLDSFTDAAGTLLSAHTPDAGGAWSAQPGVVAVNTAPVISAAGRLYTNAAAGTWRNAAVPASADHYAQADFTKLSLVASQTAGLAVRMALSDETLYFGRYTEASGGLIQVFKIIASTATQVGSSLAHSWAVGATKTFRVEVSGGTNPVIVVKVDGATLLTVTDNAGTRVTANGRCGVRNTIAVTSTTGIHQDNFEAGA